MPVPLLHMTRWLGFAAAGLHPHVTVAGGVEPHAEVSTGGGRPLAHEQQIPSESQAHIKAHGALRLTSAAKQRFAYGGSADF